MEHEISSFIPSVLQSGRQTSSIPQTSNPIWNFAKSIQVPTSNQNIVFKVKSVNTISLDSLVGQATFHLDKLNGQPYDEWVALLDKDGKPHIGKIHVKLIFIPDV